MSADAYRPVTSNSGSPKLGGFDTELAADFLVYGSRAEQWLIALPQAIAAGNRRRKAHRHAPMLRRETNMENAAQLKEFANG
jgi:hypothetical protein